MQSISSRAFPPGFIKQLREHIARAIELHSAHEVPAICRRYGLANGEVSEAFGGKRRYASKRLIELSNDRVVQVAREVAEEDGDQELIRLLGALDTRTITPMSAGLEPSRRTYYAERNGLGQVGGRLDIATLTSLFKSEYVRLEAAGYFAEHFGFWCVDADLIEGRLGADIGARMLFSLGKPDLWPIQSRCEAYSEDDLFSVIEYLFDHVSRPLTSTMHNHAGCGMHWETFEKAGGQAEFRTTMNVLLDRFGVGYELSSAGEVMERAPDGTESLLTTTLPHSDTNIQGRVQSAVTKFRQRQSTADDRRDAVRDLADVLEYLRPQAKDVITRKDDGALFEIANNFGIRHHNPAQKTDYDPAIWLSWMFYFYLATIHAVVRLIAKAKGKVA